MKTKFFRKTLSILICFAMLLNYVPIFATVPFAGTVVEETVSDPGTADTWETMMGTDADGNRYAGRVWVDKSVYKDGDSVILNNRREEGSSFDVSLKDDEAFQIVFSALGSTMTTKSTVSSTGPMDVVLVLDTSTSMDDEDRYGVTRLERTIEAANSLLSDLLTLSDVRIAIVTYNKDSETVLELAKYTNGIRLVVTDYYNNGSSDAGVVTAYDNNNRVLGKDNGYTQGTNLQSGIDRGFNILSSADEIDGRAPVAIVLTDGQANRASQEGFYEIAAHSDKDGTSASNRNLYLSTLLNAAYTKTKIEANYGRDATVYTVGVDVSGNTVAQLLMNPSDNSKGFNGNNSDREIREAYKSFENWSKGQNVTYSGWTFNHNYPKMNGAITDAKIAANINYADTYYDVSNAEIKSAFDQIYEELSSGAFNPISDSSTSIGGTGVDDTPLIYVDFIGQYMEIKEIQSITLFGSSFGVINNGDGTYTVDLGTGTNPTTNESWNTSEDIRITVIEEDGVQKLEIRINQEILPIIREQVISETVGDVTSSTITELMQEPLRVFYTVGINSDILLPGGEIDVSKLDGYEYIDDENGTVSFYSNRFGVMNPADASENLIKGDAHVGFRPSPENRYYYHQTNQGIFTKITNKSDGSTVTIAENNEYGIVWNEAMYELTWMTYDEYKSMKDGDIVYTYVSYYHPTPSFTDAASAAEEITYLVYTDWSYLKESVAFYDDNSETYLNGGKAIDTDEVEAVLSAYMRANPKAELYAVLGVGSHRTSRLHNMTVDKTANDTNTAVVRYAPEYTYTTADKHNGNDVVVWLGNNGRLTVKINTGIALTKAVTEAIGNASDTYELTVTVPEGVTASPVVIGEDGNEVVSNYENNVLTVNVKAGQTVYVHGIPGGTECVIGENVKGDYYIESKTDTVTVPLVSEVIDGAAQFAPAVVTNAPYKYGDLFITKAVIGDHAVPESIYGTAFEIKANVGAELAGKSFFVEDSAHSEPYEVTVDGEGNLTFEIKARQTVEILGLPEGTSVTVTETAPDSHFEVSYASRDYSGAPRENDNTVVIPAGARSTAVVYNHYTPFPVTVDLDVTVSKNFADESVADRLAGGVFEFIVEKFGTESPIARGTVSYDANEYGEKSVTIADVLKNEIYTEAGTYSYKVSEVKGNVTNVTYDRTVYTFDVVVTDNGGQLEAKVIGINNTEIKNEVGDGALDYVTEFTNTYKTAPISMDITKVVENNSGDNTVSAQGFKFKSVRVDKDGVPIDPDAPETATNTIISDAAGDARISGIYTKEQIGTHHYIVYEVNDGRDGWTYSEAQYFVTVEVTQDDDGNLSADMSITPYNDAARNEKAPTVADSNKGRLYFTNTYDPEDVSVDLDGAVYKILEGKTLEADMFTFHVYNDGDRNAPILSGTNDLEGDVHFVDFDKELTFDKAGTYRFDIVEYIPEGASYDAVTGKYVLNGMSYDATVYDLVVEVTNDTATGKLAASYYFEDAVTNTVTFRNSYKAASTEYALGGVKVLHGRAPRGGEFEFGLYENGDLIETVTNSADGSFAFSKITYTEAGTYTYTVREKAGNVAGVSYDGAENPVEVIVTVTDTNGVLSASASVANSDVRFENTYTAKPAKVTFGGTKVLEGIFPEEAEFTFEVYRTDYTFDITNNNSVLINDVTCRSGEFSFDKIELSKTGTYFFVIRENATDAENIVFDGTEHSFIVAVSDIGNGQLRAVVINTETGVSTAAASEAKVEVTFTNATFDEVTKKEVYLEGNTETEIDGKKVEAGETLTYFITYTNYTGKDVVVDIKDAIPRYTTYVENSASAGGTYAGAHINWILNVKKGESVTVSFDVTVDETEAIIANTAVVRDGTNTYTTNEVVNHTIEDVLEKDVFYPADTEVSIDGKKVYEGEELLYTISFTNATAQVVDIAVTDEIPENTTYVEGSADMDGVYENGAVVWNVNGIPAWSTVTVSFKVTVNAGSNGESIVNVANAFEGENTYVTNVVTNTLEVPQPDPVPTPDPERDPEPEPKPETESESKPTRRPDKAHQTGDNLSLLFALLFVSGIGIALTTISMKKKKEAEEK